MSNFYTEDGDNPYVQAVQASQQSAAPAQVANLTFFPGFEQRFIHTSGATINTLIGGNGPPLLLLHGFPESHVAWHKVASTLAEKYTVVLTDLRGYGDSSKPPGGPDHIAYSKREMGRDQLEVMQQLGFKKFQAVGHDRGGRVLFQMMLDAPQTVERGVVMSVAPIRELFANLSQGFATAFFYWLLQIQPAPLPERMINASLELYISTLLSEMNQTTGAVTPEAYAEYLRGYRNPASIHAVCEDYRASVTIDAEIEKSLNGQKAAQPLLVLWGQKETIGLYFDVLGMWKQHASHVQGYPLPCGHLIPEEDPQGLLQALDQFLQ
ncbi:alpha/beta fold hydrolase [Paenibacillus pinihumi]|uniref:alpha/beta fold hydrolase n=1 Tax=Paenibacillus pinihumi TaxID=669462 RepID=UPI000421DFBC|nr:alpha/beta hydrolase [Paenibacillus pinihumi]